MGRSLQNKEKRRIKTRDRVRKRERAKAARRDGGRDMSDDVGVAVECRVCGLRKKPIGRDAPMETAGSLCDWECPGYHQDPKPGSLWPGETRAEFGY